MTEEEIARLASDVIASLPDRLELQEKRSVLYAAIEDLSHRLGVFYAFYVSEDQDVKSSHDALQWPWLGRDPSEL
jgi:hypothetical protein